MALADVLAVVTLLWQVGSALMGKPAVVSRRAKVCDLRFHEFNRAPIRQWMVAIRIGEDIAIRNAEGMQYRFEARLRNRNGATFPIQGGWNDGRKEKLHDGPIELSYEGVPIADYVSRNIADLIVEVWITIGTKRRKTLFKGHPTAITEMTRDN